MSQLNSFIYTWQMFDDDIKTISNQVVFSDYDMLVGIAAGGLPLLTKLHNITKLPYRIIECSSYEQNKKGQLHIYEYVHFIEGKRILLIDDVADTGETLKEVKEHCQSLMVEDSEIETLTLFYKPRSIVVPHWYVREVSDSTWIIFPWE